jgi:hypothetical protein
MTNEYKMSQNWGGQDPHSPSTGHFQAEAGSGMHASISAQRWAARRHNQFQPLPLPDVQSPLAGLNDSAAFVNEIARDTQRDVPRDMIMGALSGALVGYAITRRVQRRRSR